MKYYNIICHDGKSIEINEEQEKAFYLLSTKGIKGMRLKHQNNYISFSNVARVESSTRRDNYIALPGNKTKNTRARDELIKGFKSHFEGCKIPANS